MGDSEKLVVYYSCFNYEVDPQEFPQLECFRYSLLSLLGEDWQQSLQRELEFLNIRLAKYSLEVLIEIFLSIIQKSLSIDFASFKQTFKDELSLNSVWTEKNQECALLESRLYDFFIAAMSLPNDIDIDRYEFKVLPSARVKSQLQPLVVAQEEVQNFASRVCKVLRRASLPLEAIIGPEMLASLSNYIDSLSNRVLSTFQVTSQVVTNIIEVNPFNLNVKVRVIQPARDFYNKAIEIWISLNEQLNPTDFVLSVKAKMGSCWTEKLLNPALHFYQIASDEWIKSKGIGIDYFTRRVNERLWEMWRQSIIEASKSFQEHMIPKTII